MQAEESALLSDCRSSSVITYYEDSRISFDGYSLQVLAMTVTSSWTSWLEFVTQGAHIGCGEFVRFD
jgi:hypothetical protein